MWSKLSNLNSKNLIVISIFFVLLLIIAAYFIPKYFYVQDGGVKIGKVVGWVKGQAITEGQLASFDKIYNAQARYQQRVDPKVKIPTREETIEALKEATVIAIEAKNRSVSVSEEEIKHRAKSFNPAIYGLNREEFSELVKMQVLRQKLTDVLVAWRIYGFIAIRFDLLSRNINLAVLKPKAQKTLESKKSAFGKRGSASRIAQEIRVDPEFIKSFSTNKLKVSPVQFKEVPSGNSTGGKVVDKGGDQSLDNYVLKLAAPSIEVWCSEAACYLIKLAAGNTGQYQSLTQWLDKELKR